MVEEGLAPTPPGVNLLGKVFRSVLKAFVAVSVQLPGVPVNLALEDKDLSLEAFGVRGSVLHTPGRTMGSMSLLLDSGDAFVGDLALGGLPGWARLGSALIGEDPRAIEAGWRLLLDRGTKVVHPGHGSAFKSDVLKRQLHG